MGKSPQRIIEAALFDGELGVINSDELMSMPEDKWVMLRQIITDGRQGRLRKDVARCLMCGAPVFIQSKAFGSDRLPYYAHYQGSDENCPWHHGRTNDPDVVRADQYRGNQESATHRMLCQRIAELAAADERHVATFVDQYLPPTDNDHGRYPDVRIEWQGFQPFIIELQLSKTFQTEISARCIHYDREGMPLIWVLFGSAVVGSNVPQSFRDVIVRHRNNAFTISNNSIRESVSQKTLVLSCYLRLPDGTFEVERLVRLDQLTFPQKGLPFFEDRLTNSLLGASERLSEQWWSALKEFAPDLDTAVARGYFDGLVQDISALVPALQWWLTTGNDKKWQMVHAIAVMFSVISEAQGGFINLVTKQPNVVGMLNSKLSGGLFAPFAQMVETLLRRTAACSLFDTSSIPVHLRRARESAVQITEKDPPGAVLTKLLPLAFDPVCRRDLDEVGALPEWAAPARPVQEN